MGGNFFHSSSSTCRWQHRVLVRWKWRNSPPYGVARVSALRSQKRQAYRVFCVLLYDCTIIVLSYCFLSNQIDEPSVWCVHMFHIFVRCSNRAFLFAFGTSFCPYLYFVFFFFLHRHGGKVQDKVGRVLGGGVANRFEGRLNMIKVQQYKQAKLLFLFSRCIV